MRIKKDCFSAVFRHQLHYFFKSSAAHLNIRPDYPGEQHWYQYQRTGPFRQRRPAARENRRPKSTNPLP